MDKKGNQVEFIDLSYVDQINDENSFLVFVTVVVVAIVGLRFFEFDESLKTDKYIWQRDILNQWIVKFNDLKHLGNLFNVGKGEKQDRRNFFDYVKKMCYDYPQIISMNTITHEEQAYKLSHYRMNAVQVNTCLTKGTRIWSYWCDLFDLLEEVLCGYCDANTINQTNKLAILLSDVLKNYGKKYGINWTPEGANYFESQGIKIYHYGDVISIDDDNIDRFIEKEHDDHSRM